MKLMTLSFVAASAFSLSFLGLDTDKDLKQSEVPSVVLNAVTTAHPGVANIEWEKTKDLYEAEFDKDTKEYTVQLNASGTIVQTKIDATEAELPATVKSAISSAYANQKIDDVDVVEKNGRTYYQVELDGKLKDTKLVFDETGKEASGVSYWD
ncbi:PepSY-like domain-containing protein [Pontibacter sp. Tf4]|uniref:PepSY-like domain-containing protein n=1 Tax=Pontibacter sp. Tf4 TaxID=2761620 RepID=UPI001625A2EB|nr:PepSY-like domain-containing protein [Pontibacter sp. Tf4]MBB6612680.1 PepSY-like domain-containing protein [Pontibacter sp. Tf4]